QTKHATPAEPPYRRHRCEVGGAVVVEARDEGHRRAEIQNRWIDRLMHTAMMGQRCSSSQSVSCAQTQAPIREEPTVGDASEARERCPEAVISSARILKPVHERSEPPTLVESGRRPCAAVKSTASGPSALTR